MRPAALSAVLLSALPLLAACGSSASSSSSSSSSRPSASAPDTSGASGAGGQCGQLQTDLGKLQSTLTGATSNHDVAGRLDALKPTLTADVASGTAAQRKAVADLDGVIDTIAQAAARNAASAPAGLQMQLVSVEQELAAACG